MLRSIGAVLAGYATIVVGTLVLFAVLGATHGRPDPKLAPPLWYTLVVLAAGIVFAAIGGFVCAWVAAQSEWKHALWLAGLCLALGIASSFSPEYSVTPAWYRFGLPVVGAVGVLLGARIRLSA